MSGNASLKTLAETLATADPGILLKTQPRNTPNASLSAASRSAVEPGVADILIDFPISSIGSIGPNDAPHPAALSLRGPAPATGWAVVANARSAFEKEMEEAGWVLFFMAGEVKATALGFDRTTALRNALTQLTRKARARNCNALEITSITCGSFLGFSRVSIGVHLRHLQKGGPLWQSARWQVEMGQ